MDPLYGDPKIGHPNLWQQPCETCEVLGQHDLLLPRLPGLVRPCPFGPGGGLGDLFKMRPGMRTLLSLSLVSLIWSGMLVRFPMWLQQGMGPHPRADQGDQTKGQLKNQP